MVIHIFSLKIYWYNESRQIKSSQQKKYNQWIDQIVSVNKKDQFCSHNGKDLFPFIVKLHCIEFGDYLVVNVSKNYVTYYAN